MVYWNRLSENASVCEREKENFLEKAAEHLRIISMTMTHIYGLELLLSVYDML